MFRGKPVNKSHVSFFKADISFLQPSTPPRYFFLKFRSEHVYLMISLGFEVVCGVLWYGLWCFVVWFVVFCGVLWWFVVFCGV